MKIAPHPHLHAHVEGGMEKSESVCVCVCVCVLETMRDPRGLDLWVLDSYPFVNFGPSKEL